jgi:SAM-dependent methyltransferase
MSPIAPTGSNAGQIEYWNGPVAERWTSLAEGQEPRLSPFGDAALEVLDARPGETVLDIGCGNGFTALQLARSVGPGGRVVGIDVSAVMLADARRRIAASGNANIEIMEADAATHDFAPGAFARAYSRFGVMFFADPAAAFANIRGGLEPGARLAFAAWREMAANPSIQITVDIGTRHLERHNPAGPTDPGPFAFADPDRVARILAEAGFAEIKIAPHDTVLNLGPDVETALARLTEFGPMATPIQRAPNEIRARVMADLAEAIAPRLGPEGVTFEAACWIVTAENPG